MFLLATCPSPAKRSALLVAKALEFRGGPVPSPPVLDKNQNA
jgi:hypothetical protein